MKELEHRIHRILVENWDPIGVKLHPEVQDEYDSYIAGIVRLLLGGADKSKIVDHLRELEINSMGLRGSDDSRLSPVAEALFRVTQSVSRQ